MTEATEFCVFYFQGCTKKVSVEEIRNLFPTRVDDVDEAYDAYCKVGKLLQDAKKNARKIASKFRDLWEGSLGEMLPESQDECDAPEAREQVDCFCTLLYDLKKKVHVTVEKLDDAKAEEKHIEILRDVSEKIYKVFVKIEAHWGLVKLATERAMTSLGQPLDICPEKQGTGTARAVRSMERLKALLQNEVSTKKVEFFLTVLREERDTIFKESEVLHKKEADGEACPEMSSAMELMDEEVLKQVEVIYVEALRIVAKEVTDSGMPQALSILLGANWRDQAESERARRLRTLSLHFHPDKVNWIPQDILQAAKVQDPREISDTQNVVNNAMGFLKNYFETVEKGKEELAKANLKWQEALEKSQKEKDAREKQLEAQAESLKHEKETCAVEALEAWRGALRIFSDPKKEATKDRYLQSDCSNLRLRMAAACEMLSLFLECQVYLLSAMRGTAQRVSECPWTEMEEMDKHRRQWVEERSFLRRLSNRAEVTSPPSNEGATAQTSQTTVLCIPERSLHAVLNNNLNSDRDLDQLVSATRSFDVESGLVLGAAMDDICANQVDKKRAAIEEEMSQLAEKAAAAALQVGRRHAVGVLKGVSSVGVKVATVAHSALGPEFGLGALIAVSLVPVVVGLTFFAVFWLAGSWFSGRCRLLKMDRSFRFKARQEIVIEVMSGAEKKRKSCKESAGDEFLQALSVDLSTCHETTKYLKKGNQGSLPCLRSTKIFGKDEKILKYPSTKFVTNGELIEDVGETIKFLTEDVEICAAGVLMYLVNASEVIAGKKMIGLGDGVGITQQQRFNAAKQLMHALLEQSGGVTRTKKQGACVLESNPDRAALLKKAQAEDKVDKTLEHLKALQEDGVVKIEQGTKVEDVETFLSEGWFAVYISSMPPDCGTITHDNLEANMKVEKVEVISAQDSTTVVESTLDEIKKRVASQDYKRIVITAVRGSRARINIFVSMCFSSAPTKEKGPKEREIIKLREILKINLAVVYLISTPVRKECGGGQKNAEELMAEWLLQDVIATIEKENLGDAQLLRRVEALKDFFLVFVGRPLALESE